MESLISSLKAKIDQLEQFNKALSRENTEQGNLINQLRNELNAVKPEGDQGEIVTVAPDDLIKVKIVREKYNLQMDDIDGNPHNYTTGDVFEMSALNLQFYPKGAIVPLSELKDE
jgi:hypothetical protein